jgi:hypothetical protein
MFLGIGLRLGMLGSVFSPANLFASSEQGAWYDPSDLSTLFQDSLGTTPVTTAGQPVGLMLDKSQGLVLGPELITNGDFATDSDWTKSTGWTIAGGVASFNPTGQGANSSISQDVSVTWSGQNLADISTNGSYEYRATASNGSIYIVKVVVSGMTVTGLGQIRITAASTSIFATSLNGRSFSGSIDNISVKLLPGNHATQATSAKRPTYRYVWDGVGPLGPELVTNGDFPVNTAGWTPAGGPLPTVSVVGGALRVTGAAGSVAYQENTVVVGKSYNLLATSLDVNGLIRVGTSLNGAQYVQLAGNTDHTITIVATSTSLFVSLRTDGTPADFDNISVREIPVGSRLHYLAFDGVDDSMSSTGVSISQPLTASVGGRMDGTSTPQRFFDGVSARTLIGRQGATESTIFSGNTLNFTDLFSVNVYAGFFNGASSIARLGGSVAATGNAGSNALNNLRIGASNTDSERLNGAIFGLIIVNRALSASETLQTEAYLARLSGVTL